MHSCLLSHKYEQFLFKATFSKSIIFKVKSMFEPNVLKLVMKKNFISSSPFALLITNVRRNGAHLVFKKIRLKKIRNAHSWGLSAKNMQKHFLFVSSFEHINFAINEKYSKFFYDNPNYYVSLMIFQTYKNVFLRSVHSLGWLLWLWFYPKVFWKINGKYSKKIYDNPNYYVSLMIFQTYKNVFLRSVHSLGWLLWLCFYPKVFSNMMTLLVNLVSIKLFNFQCCIPLSKYECSHFCFFFLGFLVQIMDFL